MGVVCCHVRADKPLIGLLVVAGTITLLVGFICCTQRAEDYWRNRNQSATPTQRVVPPFRTSHTQCAGCGMDGQLLNLEERCIYCHEKHYQ